MNNLDKVRKAKKMIEFTITLHCLICGFKGKGKIKDKKPYNKIFKTRKCPMCPPRIIDLKDVSPKPWLNE